MTDLPEEFLRDSSCWLDAQKTEQFLSHLVREYGKQLNDPHLIENVGHHCHELWSWGVLDSVLRMIPNAQDVYQQPHRFLSYFISPAPELTHMKRENESIRFTLPGLVPDEYPLAIEYLRSALEALPHYLGKLRAMVRWQGQEVCIGWSEAQESFFNPEEREAHFKPELVQAMRQSLEQAQQELEERKRELVNKDEMIHQYQNQLKNLSGLSSQGLQILRDFAQAQHWDDKVNALKVQLRRLNDYMVRAQQLVTLLVSQGGKNSQIQEAMKRVDWELIRTSYPQMIKDMTTQLTQIQQDWHHPEAVYHKNEIAPQWGGEKKNRDSQLNL